MLAAAAASPRVASRLPWTGGGRSPRRAPGPRQPCAAAGPSDALRRTERALRPAPSVDAAVTGRLDVGSPFKAGSKLVHRRAALGVRGKGVTERREPAAVVAGGDCSAAPRRRSRRRAWRRGGLRRSPSSAPRGVQARGDRAGARGVLESRSGRACRRRRARSPAPTASASTVALSVAKLPSSCRRQREAASSAREPFVLANASVRSVRRARA